MTPNIIITANGSKLPVSPDETGKTIALDVPIQSIGENKMIRTDVKGLLITTSELSGELAKWAVQQSPYTVPDNLAEAVTAFDAAWPYNEEMPSFRCKEWESYQALYTELERVYQGIPQIMAWNERKNGRDGMGFSSRYDQPEPDDDFIDIGALANNVAHSVWADACEFHDFNKAFDAKYGPTP